MISPSISASLNSSSIWISPPLLPGVGVGVGSGVGTGVGVTLFSVLLSTLGTGDVSVLEVSASLYSLSIVVPPP